MTENNKPKQLYRITWTAPSGKQGYGAPMPEAIAKAWLEHLESEHPETEHRIEPVEQE